MKFTRRHARRIIPLTLFGAALVLLFSLAGPADEARAATTWTAKAGEFFPPPQVLELQTFFPKDITVVEGDTIAWNIISFFWPIVPKIPVRGRWFVFLRNFPRINVRLNFLTAGLAYFANLNILFSIWFFFLVYWVENGILNRIGYAITPQPPSRASISLSPSPVSGWKVKMLAF